MFAQDPVFNNMDKELLNFVGVEVVEDPEAFSLVSEHTFLYAPGAERTHLARLLSKNPVLFFGGPLENGPRSNVYEIEPRPNLETLLPTNMAAALLQMKT